MELRSLEKEMNDMAVLYESLRQSGIEKRQGMESDVKALEIPALGLELNNLQHGNDRNNQNDVQKRSLADILSTLESQRDRITDLETKMGRYRKRLNEVRKHQEEKISGSVFLSNFFSQIMQFPN